MHVHAVKPFRAGRMSSLDAGRTLLYQTRGAGVAER